MDGARYLANLVCSEAEKESIEDILLNLGCLNQIHWEGPEGADGLPGRPGFFQMTNKKGTVYKAHVRVLDSLPEDIWGLPADRTAAVERCKLLTEEERLSLPRTFFTNDQAPPRHPRWVGCRVLNNEERKRQNFENPEPERPLHEIVDQVLPEGVAAVTKKCTIRNLKSWLTMHMGGDHNGNKAILVARAIAHYSQCYCDRQRLSAMAQGGVSGRAGRRRGRGHGRGRGGYVQIQGSGRARARVGRRARASAFESDSSSSANTSSSDENAPLIRRRPSMRHADVRRPRRKHRRMVEEVDQPGSEPSTSDVSSLSSDLDEGEQVETSSRPKSLQRLGLRNFVEASDTESDNAVNVRLPKALDDD